MNVKDLHSDLRKVDIAGEITDVGATREVTLKNGDAAQVATAILQDSTGEVKLSLWNNEISKVRKGQRVRITNGYTTSFRGDVQLNIGRYGRLEPTS